MPKASNEIDRLKTKYRCKECHAPIVKVWFEIDDGQGAGGSESQPGYWCDVCGEVKEFKFDLYIPEAKSDKDYVHRVIEN